MMKNFKSLLLSLFILFFCLMLSNITFAATQEITAESEYRLGENDSRNTAKKAALADAKRKIIEQAGVYIESYTEVNNFSVTQDQIKTVAAAIIKIKSEKVNFYENGTICKAVVVAIVDPDKIGKVLDLSNSPSNNNEINSGSKNKLKISNVKSGDAYIPKGTIVSLELAQQISSADIQKGDTVLMRLASNLVINDVLVASKGTKVHAVVADVRKAGKWGKGGKIKLKVKSFKAINGTEVPLDFNKNVKRDKDSVGAATVSLLTYGVGTYFMKGKDIVLEIGTRFEAKVLADTDLNVAWSAL